jgi:mitogen-activated protein kinase kinase kinase
LNYYHGRDAADLSDEEDMGPRGSDGSERVPNGVEVEPPQPPSEQESERLEWQTMLASVLAGEVLKSEKTRIAVALESQGDEQQNTQLNIWLGIRARFHARSVEEERRRLQEKRMRTVDPIIEDILLFRVEGNEINTDRTTQALKEVNTLLRRLEVAQSLYPNLKAFYVDKPIAAEAQFQARCDTLNTWSTLMSTLRHQFSVLRRWTGSDTLDVTQPNTSSEVPIGASLHPDSTNPSPTPTMDGSSFVERLLKEESMQRIFERGFLVTVHAFIDSVRKAQVRLAKHFKEMNLPAFENDLVPLISFPTKLAQASLRYRLDYVNKLNDPDVLIIDQMTDDLKISIGLACTLKRQYEAFLNPDPSGSWSIPNCISDDYDATILEALSAFFKLMHWKLKSGSRAIYFKETDILEAQWATFNDVSLSTAGGSRLVAEQMW